MRKMIITVPAWGDAYSKLFLGPVLRSHRAALDRLRQEFHNTIQVRYVVQTDRPREVARLLGDLDLTLVPTPPNLPANPFPLMCETHTRGLDEAKDGDRVVLLNADIMVSVEAFAAIERRFRQGKKAIVCAGTRTLLGPLTWAPGPLTARRLTAWTLRHIHPISRSCYWGSGTTSSPWTVYFHENGSTVLRGFHLHPLAVVKDRPLTFTGSVDLNLVDNYKFDEIHLVTDADELAIGEISGAWKTHPCTEWPFDIGQIVSWAIRGAGGPMHWWNFRHRVTLRGDSSAVTIDHAVADEVMRLCPYPEALAAAV